MWPVLRRQFLTASKQRGFTLIEIMLVLVVISIMISLAVTSFARNPASDLDREGRRLYAVMQAAADEALLEGVEMAISISREAQANSVQYQFLALDPENNRWVPVESKPFTPYTLSEDFFIDIQIEGHSFPVGALDGLSRLQKQQSDNQVRPTLLLLSSGETTPFTLTLQHPLTEHVFVMSSDGVSGIIVQ